MTVYKDFPFLHFTEKRTGGNPFALSPVEGRSWFDRLTTNAIEAVRK